MRSALSARANMLTCLLSNFLAISPMPKVNKNDKATTIIRFCTLAASLRADLWSWKPADLKFLKSVAIVNRRQ